MHNTNKQYKSTLFADFFGNPKNKGNLLSFFNALNHTNYTDPEALEITTIDSVIYMGIKNDISCLIDGKMSLLEHQSTFNPNMPLRGLMYFGKLYNKYLSPKKEVIYRTSLVKIPTPQYFVIYNGNAQQPECLELRLSDAFIHPDKEKRYEWTAIMLNINPGYNEALLNSCAALKEYSIFVAKVKHHLSQHLSIGEAVTKAVDECIAENIMKDYLLQNKAGVIDMCLEEYSFERHMQLVQDELKEKDAIIAAKNATIANKDTVIAKQKEVVAAKDAALADKDALIAMLQKQLAESNSPN